MEIKKTVSAPDGGFNKRSKGETNFGLFLFVMTFIATPLFYLALFLILPLVLFASVIPLEGMAVIFIIIVWAFFILS